MPKRTYKRTMPKRLRKARKAKRVASKKRQSLLMIRRMMDHGEARNSITINCGGTNATTFDTQIRCLTPNTASNNGIAISQGSGEGDRRGNAITTKRGVIKMLITPLPYNATTNTNPMPFIFKYWVVSMRQGFPSNTPSNIMGMQTDFFDSGNAVAGLTYTTADLILPINEDKWIVHTAGERKVFWQEYIGTGGPGSVAGNGTNNDFKAFARVTINYTKYIPKIVRYTDASTAPSSKCVWLVFGCYRFDGTVLASDQRPLQVVLVNDYEFVG